MINQNKINSWIKHLATYYGLLQVVHMIFLLRAGIILIRSGIMPFPASPPGDGWNSQVLSFFIGMGIADAIAAGIAFYFLYLVRVKETKNMSLGLISLTTAFSSGFVFLVGTIASGAWNKHLIEYSLLVLVFIPLFFLYILLLRKAEDNDDRLLKS